MAILYSVLYLLASAPVQARWPQPAAPVSAEDIMRKYIISSQHKTKGMEWYQSENYVLKCC